ncbi:MAG: EamA family transporter [Casimicrobium sp.]
MNAAAFGQLLILGALWGAAFMFMRIAVPEFGAIATAGARVALACAMMLVIVVVMRLTLPLATHWKRYVIVGGVNTAIPFIMYCFAALYIPSAYSAIGNSTTPIWGALIAWLFFKERLGAIKWLGIIAAFSGVVALVGLQPVAITPMIVAGMVAVLIGAMMYATASFLIKRYLSDDGGIVGATGMVFGATLWLVPIALFAVPAKMPSFNAWGAVLALAVFCTVLGYFIFFKLIREIGPQRASSVAFLFPAFAAFWGWLFLDEPITANMLIGMALVFVGTALVSGGNRMSDSVHWQRFRDWIFWPLVFTFSPDAWRKRIAMRIANDERYFQAEVRALRLNAPHYIANLDLEAASREHRLVRFIDRCDVFLSAFRQQHSLRRWVCADEAPPPGRAAMILSAHRGNAWWGILLLALRGPRAELVLAPVRQATTIEDKLWQPYLSFRWKEMQRLSGLPIINTTGASKQVCLSLEQQGRVIALIDVPPVIAKRCEPVRFFGRLAYMPRRMIDLAFEAGAEVWILWGDVDIDKVRQTIRFERVDMSGGADAVFQSYADRLQALIEARPGSWHAWGDVNLYFESPTAAA